MADYGVIVVPYDFSEHGHAALTEAVKLAGRLDAELHLIHVLVSPIYTYSFAYAPEAAAVMPPIDMSEIRASALASLGKVIDDLEFSGTIKPHVFEGASIAETLREAVVDLGADLVVMGTHGRTGLAHAFLGSVAERTLRTSPCPVLTVRERD